MKEVKRPKLDLGGFVATRRFLEEFWLTHSSVIRARYSSATTLPPIYRNSVGGSSANEDRVRIGRTHYNVVVALHELAHVVLAAEGRKRRGDGNRGIAHGPEFRECHSFLMGLWSPSVERRYQEILKKERGE